MLQLDIRKAEYSSTENIWEIPDGFLKESRRTILKQLEDNGFRATTVKKLRKYFRTNYFSKFREKTN